MNILKILFGKRAETESQLKENGIFVFGSNILGHHNGSAAGMAVKMFGATYGKAEGLQGRSYAIPTDYISRLSNLMYPLLSTKYVPPLYHRIFA